MTLKQWESIKSPNERNCPEYLQAEEEVRGKIITVFSIQLSSDLGDKILHVMETDIGLRKQYNRKYGSVWIICIPPVVKDTKKENGTLDFLLDTDENSILKMWNKH